jgi:hypothetical protein
MARPLRIEFEDAYTVYFNRRHRLSGHLFQGRYTPFRFDPYPFSRSDALCDCCRVYAHPFGVQDFRLQPSAPTR